MHVVDSNYGNMWFVGEWCIRGLRLLTSVYET